MDEKLYGVANKVGVLLPLVAHSEVEAFQHAAEHVYGSKAQLKIGKLVLEGFKVIEVVLKAKE